MAKKTGYTVKCANDACNKDVYVMKSVYEKSETKIFCCSMKCKCSKSVTRKINDFKEKKYGYRNAFQVPEIKEKIKQTMVERYGVEHALQHPKFLQKSAETLYKHYGVRNPQQSPEINKRTFQTRKDKYNELSGAVPKQKARETNLKKYGNEYFFGSDAGRMTKDNLLNNYGWSEEQYERWIRAKCTAKPCFLHASKAASAFFAKLSNRINGNCIFAEEEYKIYDKDVNGLFIYDFKIDNVLVDYHGDYWHGNPQIYRKGSMIRHRTIEEVWERDEQRAMVAKSHGFSYMVVWESEVKENEEQAIQKCLVFISNNRKGETV